MHSLRRQLRRRQLLQAWRQDPDSIYRRFVEIRARQKLPTDDVRLSLHQIMDVILDDEETAHSTVPLMRAIAA